MTTKMTTNPIAFEQILNDNRNTWYKIDGCQYIMMKKDGSICYCTNDGFSKDYCSYKDSISDYLEMNEELGLDPESTLNDFEVVDETEALEYYKK